MIKGQLTEDGTAIRELPKHSKKRVVVICDTCGKEDHKQYNSWWNRRYRGLTSDRCRSCSGRARRDGGGLPPTTFGQDHPNWKGGKYKGHDGYIWIRVEGERLASGRVRYQKEHVLVVEQHLGRRLRQDEHVHHIDGNKTNNVLQNLFVVEGAAIHRKVHHSLEAIGYQLVEAGVVRFDRETATYQIAIESMKAMVKQR